MDTSDIIDAIYSENLNSDQLDSIMEAARDRKKDLQQLAAKRLGNQLKKGDRVRIREDAPLRPQYILGTEAEVIEVKRTRASIRLGEVHGGTRFRTGQVIVCPMHALEKV